MALDNGYELSEHDKQMIAVAEGGDPNDPSENTPPRLPSEGEPTLEDLNPEDMSKEQLLELLNKQKESDGESEEEEDLDEDEDLEDEDLDGEDDEDEDDEDEDDELSTLRQQLREREAYDVAGGKEAYAELMAWGAENLEQTEIDIFNQSVNEGSPEIVKFAVEAVKAKQALANYEANGYEGQMTEGQGGRQGFTTGYQSDAEMQADMRDPRYQTDEAFRNQVMQKLAMTTAF